MNPYVTKANFPYFLIISCRVFLDFRVVAARSSNDGSVGVPELVERKEAKRLILAFNFTPTI